MPSIHSLLRRVSSYRDKCAFLFIRYRVYLLNVWVSPGQSVVWGALQVGHRHVGVLRERQGLAHRY